MVESVKPIFAQAFFNVAKGFITYYLVYDYKDPTKYYWKLHEDEENYEKELNKIFHNMQAFLDEEKVIVNGKRCKPKVKACDIGFRGSPEIPFFVFLISFHAPIKRGINVYENEYSPELIEYDYLVYWNFPSNSKIIEIDMKEKYEIINNNLLKIYGFKGEYSSGYEMISFTIR